MPQNQQVAARNLSSSHEVPPDVAQMQMLGITVDANKPRVVPVSIAPTGREGGVSDAALVYTKHALDAIISSLNSTNGKYGESGKVYTSRDLSTCMGAWDLSVPSTNAKRPRFDKATLDNGKANKSDADTAFNFYHERSCPILLDAKHSSAGMPFCVDDFGSGMHEEIDDDLPKVLGAIVLTYGADSKFTGGVGEEGVLTKAIIEFLCDPSSVLSGTAYEGKETTDAIVVEAEEQLFTQTDADGNRSALATAALAALTPTVSNNGSGTKAASDDGVYVPTIWSGNTEREYKYCLLSNINDQGQESESKRICVAIQKKTNQCPGEKGPAKGVCRITLTLSPESVQAKKKQMAEESGEGYDYQTSSAVHRNIRHNIRLLRPPKLTAVSNNDEAYDTDRPNKRRRQAIRRTSISQLIDPTLIAIGIRCKHELLLDDDEVGKVYVNGVLVADCNLTEQESKKITCTSALTTNRIQKSDSLPAHLLFGVDFTLPSSKGLPNKSVLEREYGFLLMDALITPHQKADVVGKVLNRLISGKTEENGIIGDDDDQAAENTITFDSTSSPCLESIVLSSKNADPVGIGAKSLGTKFRMEHGAEAYPCEIGTDEEYRLHASLGAQKVAVAVPTRARNILRRGGYLSLDQMAGFMWKRSGSSFDDDHAASARAAEAIEKALKLLPCDDVTPSNIRFVSKTYLGPEGDVSKLRSWYDAGKGVYYISDAILSHEAIEGGSKDQDTSKSDGATVEEEISDQSDQGGNEGCTRDSSSGKNDNSVDKAKTEKAQQSDGTRPSNKNSGENSMDTKEECTPKTLPPEKESCQNSSDKITSSEDGECKGSTPASSSSSMEDAAYLLAFYIAKEHPDVMILEKFVKSRQ